MPRVVNGQRKRAYKPKTRSGCITCKHIKCDEAKPCCQNCTSTGRKCDGYDVAPAKSSSNPTPSSIGLSPSFDIVGSDLERRSFHFFRTTTAYQLSGFFKDEFWETLTLRSSHFEPSILHAVIALGALHENFVRNRSICGTDDFALQQYNQAIRYLIEPFSRKSKQSMDTMQGSFGLAISHVQSGAKILCEIEYDENKKEYHHQALKTPVAPYVSMRTLEELFMRLDFQVTQMVGGHKWDLYRLIEKSRLGNDCPEVFQTLAQARQNLWFNWNRFTYAIRDVAEVPECDFDKASAAWQAEAVQKLELWDSALEGFLLSKGASLTDFERKGARILQVQRNIAFTSLDIPRTKMPDEMKWDQYSRFFNSIVDLAEEVIDLQSVSPIPEFSLDMGIVGPLYEVAGRCRDPLIRRRAIQVLKSTPLQEGVWNSFLVAKVAERVVEIEEEGLLVLSCEDVPDSARILDVRPSFDSLGRRGIIRYTQKGTDPYSYRTVEEVLEW